MLRAYLYDSAGRDREIDLHSALPKLSSQHLLWIDITGRDGNDIERINQLIKLDSHCRNDLRHRSKAFQLKTYGGYLHFNIASLKVEAEDKSSIRAKPQSVQLDFIVGKLWLITIHDEPLAFLKEFREQDRGDTLIGRLSPSALASSLLDWHLGPYLQASENLEDFCDKLDQRILKGPTNDFAALPEIVRARTYVSELRALLLPQRSVFYGLSRADVALLTGTTTANQFGSLEHHFERAVDIIERGRDLVRGSFDLYSTKIAETTNVLIRRLTFISIMLGAIGAVAGVFGMNFDTPYTHAGVFGFWAVVGTLAFLGAILGVVSRWKHWI